MKISLDYDNTYTLDPEAWDQFILDMQERMHEVFIVTARTKPIPRKAFEHLLGIADGIYQTDSKAKKDYMKEMGIDIDVWIDDDVKRILKDKKHK